MRRAFLEFSGPPGTTLPWSLLRIVDEAGGDTGFGVVRSPVGAQDRAAFEQFARERRLIGLGPDNAASRLAAFLGQAAARDGQGSGAGGIPRPALRVRAEPAPPAQV